VEFWVLVAFLIGLLSFAPYERLALAIRGQWRSGRLGAPIGTVSHRIGDRYFVANLNGDYPQVGNHVLLDTDGGLIVATPVAVDPALGSRKIGLVVPVIGNRPIVIDARARTLSVAAAAIGPARGPVQSWQRTNGWTSSKQIDDLLNPATGHIVGTIAPGSDGSQIFVDVAFISGEDKWAEGAVLSCEIEGSTCLLQVVRVEAIQQPEEDSFRPVRWRLSTKKLGEPRDGSPLELAAVPWVPLVGDPVTIRSYGRAELRPAAAEETLVVGSLPGVDVQTRVQDVDSFITHNSAFLGALGTGKTTLAVRLLADSVTAKDVRLVVIDITGQHRALFDARLPGLVENLDATVSADLSVTRDHVVTHSRAGNTVQDPGPSGNHDKFAANVRKALCDFLFATGRPADPAAPVIDGVGRVLVLNPDDFDVTKGEKVGFQVICVPLSTAEKTRIIAEELLRVMMQIGLSPGRARVGLVLEEAHILVPEFTFVAQDGDRAAANGTARVVLQGRKYGLGTSVIAQRTANVSKSVLSQCATLFALRMFDDTGREFLSNFIGSDYAATLSSLQDWHAIAVGSGLGTNAATIVRLPAP
jgi:hypothetical protein